MRNRVLLTVVCDGRKPHVLARVTADPRGLLLTISRTSVGDVAPEGSSSYVNRKRNGSGFEIVMPDDEVAVFTASCGCGRDFDVSTDDLRRFLAAGSRRVVLAPPSMSW